MTKTSEYKIPLSRECAIGTVKIGVTHPVAVQSMTNTNTNDIQASVVQCKKIIDAGGELVRFTTQGEKEVKSLSLVISKLREEQIQVPIVADVHFRASVADAAAKVCEKVRINPGNFTEKKSHKLDYSEAEYQVGIEENRKRFLSFINICKSHNTAIRIGVNHGSLSQRIMSRYGDTPKGMVVSTMEFLRTCNDADFHDVVVSLKSSNTRLMVHAVRMLVKNMIDENLYYPIHLGVTESGNGAEGRIKSVVGVAALLQEGIGDTIRISLTEPPEDEIPVAINITKLFPKPQSLPYRPLKDLPWDPFQFDKPLVKSMNNIGGKNPPVVIAPQDSYKEFIPDFSPEEKSFFHVSIQDTPEEIAALTEDHPIILNAENNTAIEIKSWLIRYYAVPNSNPVILRKAYKEKNKDLYSLKAAGEFGLLLIDGLLSGVWIENSKMTNQYNCWLSFYILQAARERTSVTDFIACPSCGRTLFDIQTVLEEVKAATGHLKGLKIAVMGCVVNGPGEMADADYGYIGAAQGKVSIYKGKTAIEKNVPSHLALEKLIAVIKVNGDWK